MYIYFPCQDCPLLFRICIKQNKSSSDPRWCHSFRKMYIHISFCYLECFSKANLGVTIFCFSSSWARQCVVGTIAYLLIRLNQLVQFVRLHWFNDFVLRCYLYNLRILYIRPCPTKSFSWGLLILFKIYWHHIKMK